MRLVMDVLTQQKVEVDLNGLLKANVDETQKESSVERLRKGIKVAPVQTNADLCNIQLSEIERRSIIELTLKMGNKLFYNPEKGNTNPDFKHSYSLRFIEIDVDAVRRIEINV